VFWVSSTGAYQDNVTGGNVIQLGTSAIGSNSIAVHNAAVYWPVVMPGNGAYSVQQGTVGTATTQTAAGSSSAGGASTVTGILYDAVGNAIFGGYNTGSGYGLYRCPLTGTPGCASVISFGGVSAKNIATDGVTYVYMADQSGVIEQVTLAAPYNASSLFVSQATPTLLRVDGTHLYWVNSGSKTIWRSTLAGASSGQIASTTDAADGLAADSVYVYWTDSAAGTVNYAPIGGGGPATPYVTQSASTTPMLLVRDSKSLYWTNSGSIYRVALP
jgi:hypothetical protein